MEASMEESMEEGGMEEILESLGSDSAPSDSDSDDQDGPVVPVANQFDPMYGTDEEESEAASTSDLSSEESEFADHEDNTRIQNTDWCLCGHCELMPTTRESICCKELNILDPKIADRECVTRNEYFTTLCIDREVLDVALLQMNHFRADLVIRPTPSRSYRRVAYRSFTLWTWDRLGKHVRRVIPACAVTRIRTIYPEGRGVYTGYKEYLEQLD